LSQFISLHLFARSGNSVVAIANDIVVPFEPNSKGISGLHAIKPILQRGWNMELLYYQDCLVDLPLTKLEISVQKSSHRIGLLGFVEIFYPS
jgi:hypothetical protein